MFCKHEWKVLSETTTESQMELAVRLGAVKLKNPSSYRQHIQIVTCSKCGKLKRFTETLL